MGLDINFITQKAIQAGMTILMVRTGSNEDIEIFNALNTEDKDPEYLKYLLSTSIIATINNGIHGGVKAFNADMTETSIIIRANKWGNNYLPLTTWLTNHNVSWDEF